MANTGVYPKKEIKEKYWNPNQINLQTSSWKLPSYPCIAILFSVISIYKTLSNKKTQINVDWAFKSYINTILAPLFKAEVTP